MKQLITSLASGKYLAYNKPPVSICLIELELKLKGPIPRGEATQRLDLQNSDASPSFESRFFGTKSRFWFEIERGLCDWERTAKRETVLKTMVHGIQL